MKLKVFPARIKKVRKKYVKQIELALINAPKAPIEKLHKEARQFELFLLARRNSEQ